MPDNIGTVVIPAPVVQLKDTQFIYNGAISPQILEVPCIQINIDIGRYWAVPTRDNGIFTGWWYQPATTETGQDVPIPNIDSFQVLRIRDKISDYTWWILATLTEFTAACNTCCGESFTPIEFFPPVVAPCQKICDSVNEDGNYYGIFSAPDLGENQQYEFRATFDDFSADGETALDLDGVISSLNANFSSVGDESPPIQIVWTRDGNTIFGTLQDGRGAASSLCLVVFTEPLVP